MKTYKLALLISVLILPAQGLLAGNFRDLAKPVIGKSTVAAPAKTTAKPKKATLGQVLKASRVNKTPGSPGRTTNSGGTANGLTTGINSVAPETGKMKIFRTLANLKILSLGWNKEFCRRGCPELTRISGFDIPTCDLTFQVTNTGDTPSGSFRVKILKTALKGTEVAFIALKQYTLAAHETKTFKISSESLGIYKIGKRITLEVDGPREVAESNEYDNSATFVPQ